MNILLICKYNRFRSKFAEAYFKKGSKKHKTRSAGVIKDNPISKKIERSALARGLKITKKHQELDLPTLKWKENIVIVAA